MPSGSLLKETLIVQLALTAASIGVFELSAALPHVIGAGK